jgi:hypothetical protein
MIPVVVRHRAEADVESARAWSRGKITSSGLSSSRSFLARSSASRALPDQFPEVGREVRRALLHRFP